MPFYSGRTYEMDPFFSRPILIHILSLRTKQISVEIVLHMDSLEEHFQLPLSVEAYNQFCELDIFIATTTGE
jgi:hypothetical protein